MDADTKHLDPWVLSNLTGASNVVAFGSLEQMRAAVGQLMTCHAHHFAVLPDMHYAVALSDTATQCLQAAGLLGSAASPGPDDCGTGTTPQR